MNNTISTNTNFKGAFRINYDKALKGTREYLEKELYGTRGIIVHDNFGAPNNTLYILRNSKDYDFAKFIEKNKMKFEYFPEIDTNTKLSKKEVLSAIEEKKVTVIDKIAKMIDFVVNNRMDIRAQKPVDKSYKKLLQNIFHNLQDEKPTVSKGVITLKDKTTGEIIKISPKSQFGVSYVYRKPGLKSEDIKRYAVDSDGNILATFDSPNAIIKFGENFNKAIKHNLNKN